MSILLLSAKSFLKSFSSTIQLLQKPILLFESRSLAIGSPLMWKVICRLWNKSLLHFYIDFLFIHPVHNQPVKQDHADGVKKGAVFRCAGYKRANIFVVPT